MRETNYHSYPFTAIVGQEDMKLALSLIAVCPAIGGVLISGERGTAKTTAVRALPSVLGSDIRVIELPLNATEDRVVGTLQLGTLMKSGEREFVPGLMAEADGQILYVDEINLLEDSIVDLLLDAAATGVCRVEREGVSLQYPARFILIGTMNPEEGSLRPQLLDRFGLSVNISGSLNTQERLLLLRRHDAFERDPEEFLRSWQASEDAFRQRIRRASLLYPSVTFSDDTALFAAGICSELGVDGYRGDMALMRTARAAAALDGRDTVTREDVLLAARFVLPHRMKKLPFEEMGLTDQMLAKAAEKLPEAEPPVVLAEVNSQASVGEEPDGKKA